MLLPLDLKLLLGVDYSSDVNEVMTISHQVIQNQESIQKTPKPFVRFVNFGDSSLDFTVGFWTEEVFRIRTMQSDIRVKYSMHLMKITFLFHSHKE